MKFVFVDVVSEKIVFFQREQVSKPIFFFFIGVVVCVKITILAQTRSPNLKNENAVLESRFLLRVEGFRVWDGRCFRVPVLTPGGRV